MERLTTDRDYLVDKEAYERHLAQGYPRSTPQERFLKLCEYERTGHTPEEIAEFDKLYLAKCQEVNRLNAELAELKKQPQGDLISRSAAMENYCSALCPKSKKGEYCKNCIAKSWLNNQPTAYDVDVVVEQLEHPNNYTIVAGNHYTTVERVVDIIRNGGKE